MDEGCSLWVLEGQSTDKKKKTKKKYKKGLTIWPLIWSQKLYNRNADRSIVAQEVLYNLYRRSYMMEQTW